MSMQTLIDRLSDKVGTARSVSAMSPASSQMLVDRLEHLVRQYSFRTVVVGVAQVAYRFATREKRDGRELEAERWARLGRRLILESEPRFNEIEEESMSRRAR